jgi:hypothetical protein
MAETMVIEHVENNMSDCLQEHLEVPVEVPVAAPEPKPLKTTDAVNVNTFTYVQNILGCTSEPGAFGQWRRNQFSQDGTVDFYLNYMTTAYSPGTPIGTVKCEDDVIVLGTKGVYK